MNNSSIKRDYMKSFSDLSQPIVLSNIGQFFTTKDKSKLVCAGRPSAHFYHAEMAFCKQIVEGAIDYNEVITQLNQHPYWLKSIEDAYRTQATELLLSILMGNIEKVLQIARLNPLLLFIKSSISNESYEQDDLFRLSIPDISPYQCMQWLVDADMFNAVLALDSVQTFLTIGISFCRPKVMQQNAELEGGGYDVIAVTQDPMEVQFDTLLTYTDTLDGAPVEYPLMQNNDAIIAYHNQYYIADKNARTVVKLKEDAILDTDDFTNWMDLKTKLANHRHDYRHSNNGRRTDDEQHQLISKALGKSLTRSGIRFSLAGIPHQDTHIPFSLLEISRGYLERPTIKHAEGFWVSIIGQAQRLSPIWLLQKTCKHPKDEGRSLHYKTKSKALTSLLPFQQQKGLGFDFGLCHIHCSGAILTKIESHRYPGPANYSEQHIRQPYLASLYPMVTEGLASIKEKRDALTKSLTETKCTTDKKEPQSFKF